MSKIGRVTLEHVVSTAAIVTVTTPPFAFFEKVVMKASDDVSMNARTLGLVLTLGGMGFLFNGGRYLWRRGFGISEATDEKKQLLYDALYAGTYNLFICPGFYYAAGSRDIEQIAIGTGIAVGLTAALGGPLGYAIDTFNELFGVKKATDVYTRGKKVGQLVPMRLPKSIQEKPRSLQVALAGITIATAASLTALTYALTPSYEKISEATPEVSNK